MRRAGQLKFAAWNLESGKREEENKNLWLSWATMPKKYLLEVSKQDKIYHKFFILYIHGKAFSV